MPTVKIELREGKETATLQKIQNTVMDAVITTLQLPDNDRNIRVIEYPEHLFQMKPPYEMLIEIAMFQGRTKATKKNLYRNIVNSLDLAKLFDKDKILIFINEQPLENWAGRGGISAEEMNLGFKVKV